MFIVRLFDQQSMPTSTSPESISYELSNIDPKLLELPFNNSLMPTANPLTPLFMSLRSPPRKANPKPWAQVVKTNVWKAHHSSIDK